MRTPKLVRSMAALASTIFLAACGDVASAPADAAGGDAATADAATADAAEPVTVTVTTYATFFGGFTGDNRANLPFVAAQDGDGQWQQLVGAGGEYSFQVASGRYGVVTVCPEAQDVPRTTEVTVRHYTISEFTALVAVCDDKKPWALGGTLSGSVSVLSDSQVARIWHVLSQTDVTAADNIFSFMVFFGIYDVGVTRHGTWGSSVDRIILNRNVDVPNGAAVVRDYSFITEGFAPDSHTFSFSNLRPNEEFLPPAVEFITAHGTAVPLYAPLPTILSVPPGELVGDELHRISVEVSTIQGVVSRGAIFYTKEVTDLDFTLLDDDVVVDVAPVTPPLRFRLTFEAVPGASRYVARVQSKILPHLETVVIFSPGWLGPGPTHEYYLLPDFAILPGWNPEWQYQAGFNGTFLAESCNRGLAALEVPPRKPFVPRSADDGLEILWSKSLISVDP